jgi:High-temperature-induced dauer-formation protein
VSALVNSDVSADNAEFWDELWKIPSSPEEVFELISPRAARKLRDEKFDNLATLFTQATAQLCQIVETPYNIYFDQALNCVRVLTRILPFLLEKGELVFLNFVVKRFTVHQCAELAHTTLTHLLHSIICSISLQPIYMHRRRPRRPGRKCRTLVLGHWGFTHSRR